MSDGDKTETDGERPAEKETNYWLGKVFIKEVLPLQTVEISSLYMTPEIGCSPPPWTVIREITLTM